MSKFHSLESRVFRTKFQAVEASLLAGSGGGGGGSSAGGGDLLEPGWTGASMPEGSDGRKPVGGLYGVSELDGGGGGPMPSLKGPSAPGG